MTVKDFTYPKPGPVALSVATISASVRVEISDVEYATVRVSTTAVDGPAHQAVEEATLEPLDGAVLKVRVNEGTSPVGGYSVVTNISGSVVINSNGIFINGIPMSGSSFGTMKPIVVHAVLPLGSSVDADTTSGAISVHGHADDLIAESVSGGIDVESARASALKTVSGAITVEKTGTCSAKTVSGRIRIDNAWGSAMAKTVSGAITIGYSGLWEPKTKTVSGRIRVRRLVVEDQR